MRDRLFQFVARLTSMHPWKIIILSLVIFAAAAGFASTIVPKLTWLDLLPEDAPSVVEFSRILDHYGSSETIIAAIEGDDRKELVDFAESFKSRIIDMKDSDDEPMRMEEACVPEASPLVGKTLLEAEIPKKTGMLVLAIKRSSGDYYFSPSPNEPFRKGDCLIVLGPSENMRLLHNLFEGKN